MRADRPVPPARVAVVLAAVIAASALVVAQSTPPQRNGALPVPLPLFPADNWWNQDISQAPVDPASASLIAFINNGGTRRLHPDFGGYSGAGDGIYGFPYVVVSGDQPKRAVQFYYPDESDGVNPATGQGFPFYPIPDEAITQPSWIEGGQPGNQAPGGDRHMLIVDKDNKHLYELFDLRWDGSQWRAGSGAFFDMKTNNRRPDGWTSADAAGLAILPGLVRYDEVFGPDEIRHAFRVTVRATNSYYVWPASHRAGSTTAAPPNGTRLRLKASKDLSGYPPEVRKIFRAMQTYGLIVADNGSDMYVSGAFDPRWDNGVLNPAFRSLTASDFEVIELGWRGGPITSCVPNAPGALSMNAVGFQVGFAWSAPAGGAAPQGYVLEAGSASGLANLASVVLPPSPLAFAATAPAGRYYVRVKGGTTCGVGPPSNDVVVDLPSCPTPAAPPTIAFSRANRLVALWWGAVPAGVAGYVLEAGSAPGAADILVSDVGKVTGIAANDVSPGTYHVRVRARNGCGLVGPPSPDVVIAVP
jgi:hypothetical protein